MVTIVSRDEYLTFRQEWKPTYLRLAKEIRALKIATRLAAKGGYTAARTLQSMRALNSNYATFLMEELEFMKEKSRMSVAFLRWLEATSSNSPPEDLF